jgi:hypothetical protein
MSEQELLAELSADRAWQTIETIVEQFPSRLAGSDAAWRAAGYLNEQLAAHGVSSELMEYPGLVSFPGRASLEVLEPEHHELRATVLAHSRPTAQPIQAELVDVGTGSWERCEQAGVRGKVTLTELSYSPPRQEKQRVMGLQGALAAIMMNWGPDDSTLLPYGSVKPCWGNPTRLTLATEMPTIPCLGISRADGLLLRGLCQRGPVTVRLSAECQDEWRPLRQAIGRIPGASSEFAIVGGHMDAWYGQAATDNAAGNACFIELARVLQRFAGETRRGLVVGCWVGHETGTMIGSSVFVDRFWDDLRANAVAYLMIDQPGLVGASVWESRADIELQPFHTAVEQRLLPGWPLDAGRLVKTGDTSFFGIGIPTIASRGAYTHAEIAAMGDASLGWWHHTDANTLERLDPDLLGLHLKVYAAYLWGLMTSPVLPARFAPLLSRFADRLEALRASPSPLDLDGPADACQAALAAARALDQAADQHQANALRGAGSAEAEAILNEALKELSRVLVPLGGSVVGPYGHDPYGLAAQTTLLSGLYELGRYAQLPADAEERHLLETELIRQGNRLVDGLRAAAREATAAERALSR